MPEFVDNTVRDIDEQLRQLRDEASRLEAARSALTGGRRGPRRPRGSANGTTATRTSRTRAVTAGDGSATTRTARRAGTSKRPRSTRRGGNTRSAQTLELVRQRPGITIPEIAEAMKIQANYLYRVLPRLASEGQVKRDGQGWHPAK
jgi:hypothetical protein